MKKIIIILLLSLADCAFAEVLMNEDFETHTTWTTTPYAVAGAVYCSSSETLCQDGDGNYAQIQSTFKHGGNNAVKARILTSGAGCGPIFEPPYYGTWSSKTSLYLRYYMYYDSAFRWYNRTKMIVWRIDNAPDLYINCNGVTYPNWDQNGAATCDVGVYFGSSPVGACSSISPFNVDEFYYVAKSTGANKGGVVAR